MIIYYKSIEKRYNIKLNEVAVNGIFRKIFFGKDN